ncbi:hypothetical protein K502DRAFT_325928 [Neoconidiobolus thromboides FSU 785]|nr:hypothetical protein K502DRAFT_325928 [Neoconidiobolus thromboides FSU 785]
MHYCSHSKDYQFHFELFDNKNNTEACGCTENEGAEEHVHKDGEICRWKGYYPIDDCLRLYCPKDEESSGKKESTHGEDCHGEAQHSCNKYCLHGVNVLNKENLDISDIKAKIKNRKESHSKVERRRRLQINNSIEEMEKLLPSSYINPNARNSKGLILYKTLAYLKDLQTENELLKSKSG